MGKIKTQRIINLHKVVRPNLPLQVHTIIQRLHVPQHGIRPGGNGVLGAHIAPAIPHTAELVLGNFGAGAEAGGQFREPALLQGLGAQRVSLGAGQFGDVPFEGLFAETVVQVCADGAFVGGLGQDAEVVDEGPDVLVVDDAVFQDGVLVQGLFGDEEAHVDGGPVG